MIDRLFDAGPLAFIGNGPLDPAEARELQRAAGADVERLRRGVYVRRDRWTGSDAVSQHRLRIDAVAGTRRYEPVIVHASAAVLWGMPVSLSAHSPVHIGVPPASGLRSKNGISVHRQRFAPDDLQEIDGLLVTTPARTALDLARTLPHRDGVVALDFVLHPRRPKRFAPLSRELLIDDLAHAANDRGHARAARAIEFARSGSDNPGESVSRVVISQLGFPTPLLQMRHRNPRGGWYFTDTEWPEFKAIGEFDGKGKYLKDEYLRGLTPGEAVYEEKIREDHLRDEHNTVTRWGWPELRNPPLLERKLLAAGVPLLRDRRRS